MNKFKLALIVSVSVLVFIGLLAYGDFREIGRIVSNYPKHYFLLALILALVNYGVRFIRWAYYLRILHVDITFRASMLIFFSGLALSVTPGKVGEFFKCYFLKQKSDMPVAHSAAVVIMERLTDLVSVLMVGLTGLGIIPIEVLGVCCLLAGSLVGFVILFKSSLGNLLYRFPLVLKWKLQIDASRSAFRVLLQVRALITATLLGVVAWASEGIALYLILKGLGVEDGLWLSVPVYAWSTIVGGLSAIPGGLVGTEVSMLAFLVNIGLAKGEAASAVLLIRLATLWFAVLLGFVAMGILYSCLLYTSPSPRDS